MVLMINNDEIAAKLAPLTSEAGLNAGTLFTSMANRKARRLEAKRNIRVLPAVEELTTEELLRVSIDVENEMNYLRSVLRDTDLTTEEVAAVRKLLNFDSEMKLRNAEALVGKANVIKDQMVATLTPEQIEKVRARRAAISGDRHPHVWRIARADRLAR